MATHSGTSVGSDALKGPISPCTSNKYHNTEMLLLTVNPGGRGEKLPNLSCLETFYPIGCHFQGVGGGGGMCEFRIDRYILFELPEGNKSIQ